MQSVTMRRAAALSAAALNGFIKVKNERRSSGTCVRVHSCHGLLQSAAVQVSPRKGAEVWGNMDLGLKQQSAAGQGSVS